MITISEKTTKKCPGKTSLFVTFNYNAQIVDIVKKCDGALFDKKNVYWEIPTTNLAYLINHLHEIDDIELNFLSEKSEKNDLNDLNGCSVPYIDFTQFKTMPFDYQKEGIIY